MTDVNHALFVDVLAQIEAHPETWRQRTWRCETGMCFAGWACELSGVAWQSSPLDDVRACLTERGVAPFVAAELLGIIEYPTKLFHADNRLDDLYRLSAEHMGIDEQVLRDKVQDRLSS